MARKWGWFSAVKKAITASDSKKDQKNHELKTTSSEEPADLEPVLSSEAEPTLHVAHPPLSSNEEPKFDIAPSHPPPPQSPPYIGTDQEEINEEIKQAAYPVEEDANTTADAQATEEVAHINEEIICTAHGLPHYLGKTNEEIAAIRIQTAIRGYLARRALDALRGLMRLETLIQGQSVKQKAAASLRCLQSLAKEESQIREWRIRLSEENQSLQRQFQHKHEKELNKAGEGWDDSTKSKEEVEARLLDRKEAAMRRERARTYSSIHQQTWKKQQPPKTGTRTSMNPDWSWRWGELWMGSRPWDERRCHVQKPRRPPTPTHHSAAVSSGDGKARPRRQQQRRHSIEGFPVGDDEGSSSGISASKLFALSSNRISQSDSKRHSCPPQMHTFFLNNNAPLHSNS